MIVRAVRQEEDCSWQDACKSWMEQDEEVAVGVYQVGMCQGTAGVAAGTGEEAVEQYSVSQFKEAGITEGSEQASGSDDLLLDGEEGEYFLELLMRKASPERPKAGQPVEGRENSRSEAASTKGKEKKRNKKKEKGSQEKQSSEGRW